MRLHFDGAPDRFTRMRALFNTASTLRQQPGYAKADGRKFRWSRLQAQAERMLAKIRRAA